MSVAFEQELTVLIADDEPLVRQLVSSYLIRDCHHEILKAKNGHEALELYKVHRKRIDLCFLDIEMPKINGLNLLREIRKIDPCAYIVILSGAGSFENVKQAIDLGVDGFIVKPFSNQKLEEALNNFIHSKQVA